MRAHIFSKIGDYFASSGNQRTILLRTSLVTIAPLYLINEIKLLDKNEKKNRSVSPHLLHEIILENKNKGKCQHHVMSCPYSTLLKQFHYSRFVNFHHTCMKENDRRV
jgi:hypothetical protein